MMFSQWGPLSGDVVDKYLDIEICRFFMHSNCFMIVSCVLWSQNAWYHLLAHDMFSFFGGPCKVHIAENFWSLSINREARSLGDLATHFFCWSFTLKMLGWESHFDWYFSIFRWFNHHQPPAIRWKTLSAASFSKTPRTLSAAQLAAGHPKMATRLAANATRKWAIPRNYRPWRLTAGTCPHGGGWFRWFSFQKMGDGCRFQPLIFQGVVWKTIHFQVRAVSFREGKPVCFHVA